MIPESKDLDFASASEVLTLVHDDFSCPPVVRLSVAVAKALAARWHPIRKWRIKHRCHSAWRSVFVVLRHLPGADWTPTHGGRRAADDRLLGMLRPSTMRESGGRCG